MTILPVNAVRVKARSGGVLRRLAVPQLLVVPPCIRRYGHPALHAPSGEARNIFLSYGSLLLVDKKPSELLLGVGVR